jgi:hypothetical protein
MILRRPVKRPIEPSADQQATLRVDSRKSLGGVRAMFSRLEQPGRSPLQGDGRGPADRFLATRVDAAISCGWRSPQREDRFRTRGMIGNVLCCETMAWNQFIGITMLLFALTNPVGAIPIFLAMPSR